MHRWLRLSLFLPLAAGVLVPAPRAAAATITVTTTADEYATGAGCSLREAIKTSNDDAAFGGCSLVPGGPHTISLPAGTFTLTLPGTDEDADLNGDLDITEDVTISGAGARATIVDGNGTVTLERVFHIPESGDTVTIQDLTVRNGVGGIFVMMGSTLDVLRSAITGNQGAVAGAGIRSFGTLNLTEVTLSGNVATGGASGGGLTLSGLSILINVTLSGNSATDSGGGIYTDTSLTLNNVTIANNTADSDGVGGGDGGGIYRASGTLNVTNSILGNNVDNSPATKHPDCSGALTSDGYNLIENTTGCIITGNQTGDVIGSDPGLLPLQDNGGPTDTHAFATSSPAFEAANPAAPGSGGISCAVTDQRGVARPQSARCDIGAFEGPLTPTPTPTKVT